MPKPYRHLDYSERIFIEVQLIAGVCPSAIAVSLRRHPTTIFRELRRNNWLPNKPNRLAGGYRALLADRRDRHLRDKPSVERMLQPGNALFLTIVAFLRQGLSPSQIARTLACMLEPVRISHETIYTSLYVMPRGELRRAVLDLLRRQHKARRTRSGPKDRRSKSIPDMTLIDQRPVEAAMKLVAGHWEGDLIIGKGNRSQVGTLVERTTLFVALVKLENGKAATAAEGFSTILNRFQSPMRLSMTYDQGTEMAHHRTLTEKTGVDVYFAHPHAPWERGLSENTNGLLRQFLPRSTDLSLLTQEDLDQIAAKLNARPRKTLAWKAPAELFLPKEEFNFVEYWSKFIHKNTTVALQP